MIAIAQIMHLANALRLPRGASLLYSHLAYETYGTLHADKSIALVIGLYPNALHTLAGVYAGPYNS